MKKFLLTCFFCLISTICFSSYYKWSLLINGNVDEFGYKNGIFKINSTWSCELQIKTENQPNEIREQIVYFCSSDGFNSHFQGVISCHSNWTMLGYTFPSSNSDTVVLNLVSRDNNERTDKESKIGNFIISCTSYKQ